MTTPAPNPNSAVAVRTYTALDNPDRCSVPQGHWSDAAQVCVRRTGHDGEHMRWLDSNGICAWSDDSSGWRIIYPLIPDEVPAFINGEDVTDRVRR